MPLIKCPDCKKDISDKADSCLYCGYSIEGSTRDRVKKNPGLAAVLSFFFAGLGQIYNGEIGKGIAFIIIYFFCLLSMLVGIGFFLVPVVWIGGMIDAHHSAERINKGDGKKKHKSFQMTSK
jgi:TM2 domain-containing membrane protein YozV